MEPAEAATEREPRAPAAAPPASGSLEAQLVEIAAELVPFLQHHAGDHHLGADLAQDVIARAIAALPALRDGEALKAWVFRIAINRFNDHVRRVRSVRMEVGLVPDREAPAEKRPDQVLMTGELDAVLRRELLALPERQRTVMMLHGVKGLDQRDIARVLGISVDAVKMSLFHAREKMRVRLARFVDQVPSKRRR